MSETLAPRILKNIQAEFNRAQFAADGTNASGIRVLGKNVLILCDTCAEKTSGGILLTADKIVSMNMAAESGALVVLGGEAFAYYDDGTKWTDYKPVAGDRVFFERYGGREIMGRDGLTYRLMSYTCVGGVEESETPPASKKPLRKPTKKG